LRPRKFLCEHFWTEKQKNKFITLDNKERAECQSSIFNIINEETKKPGSKEHQLLHKITARVSIASMCSDVFIACVLSDL
jgi:hypothetical protein